MRMGGCRGVPGVFGDGVRRSGCRSVGEAVSRGREMALTDDGGGGRGFVIGNVFDYRHDALSMLQDR